MFGKKNKKEPKVEQVFDSASEKEKQEVQETEDVKQEKTEMSDDEKLMLGVDTHEDDDGMSDYQKKQIEQLDSVKDKISKILKSSNIEIVDENFGDEYESGSGADSDEKKQQDYDSLKALFGTGDDKKGKELTLTIDDYDYTYTGQYLDEFDMVHLKGIKRIRLQNKYAKKIKKIALIASLVMVVISGAIAAFFITRETPVYLKSISLNHTEGSYFINDYFDYSGLYILAEYSDGRVERVKLKSSHLQGRVGNIVENENGLRFTGTTPAQLTFGYGGKTVNYSIIVENKRPSALAAIYSDGLFNLDAGDVINEENLKILVKYANFNTVYLENYNSSSFKIYINNVECEYDDDKNGYIASASTKPSVAGELSTATIKIVSVNSQYSNDSIYFSLEVKQTHGSYMVNL